MDGWEQMMEDGGEGCEDGKKKGQSKPVRLIHACATFSLCGRVLTKPFFVSRTSLVNLSTSSCHSQQRNVETCFHKTKVELRV